MWLTRAESDAKVEIPSTRSELAHTALGQKTFSVELIWKDTIRSDEGGGGKYARTYRRGPLGLDLGLDAMRSLDTRSSEQLHRSETNSSKIRRSSPLTAAIRLNAYCIDERLK